MSKRATRSDVFGRTEPDEGRRIRRVRQREANGESETENRSSQPSQESFRASCVALVEREREERRSQGVALGG